MDGELLVEQPLAHKLIKKGFWLYFFTLLIGPSSYFIRVLASNSLSVADVGIFYSIYSLIVIIYTYHDLGLTEALQYYLPKYRIEKKYNKCKTSLLFTIIIQMISSIIIIFVMLNGASYLALNYFHNIQATEVIKIFCLYLLGTVFVNLLYSIYISFQDIIQYKLIEFIKSYTILIFTLVFFILGNLNITNFTRAWVIGVFISLFLSLIIFIKKYHIIFTKGNIEIDKILFKRQIKYALWVFIGTNIASLLGQIDQQFVIYFLGPNAAGYYTNYLSLILAFNIITLPILAYLFPLTTELITKNQKEKLTILKNILYKYFSLFAISVSGIFLIFGKEITTILYGNNFAYSGVLLQYSAVFLIFNVLFGINFGLLAGMGEVKKRAKIIFITLFINIITNIILIKIIGLIGVVISMNISRIILFILSFRIINILKDIKFDRSFFSKNIITIILLVAIFQFIKKWIFVTQIHDRITSSYYVLIYLIIYSCIIGIINYKEIIFAIKEIKKIRSK